MLMLILILILVLALVLSVRMVPGLLATARGMGVWHRTRFGACLYA